MDVNMVNQLLAAGARNSASDIHLKAGYPPALRINGSLVEVKAPALRPEDTREAVLILTRGKHLQFDIETVQELDFSYGLPGVGRFRVNAYRQRGTMAVALRLIPPSIPTFEQLNLPPILAKVSLIERGIVLLTGITGSGKSSTLAAMVDHINEQRKGHIVTIEDPIEFLHSNKKCSISQREIGEDTQDFNLALRASLRQDPDIIMVGEMRDTETIDTALKAAETGHLVLSTVHTTDASHTIARLISVFPPEGQTMARIRIGESRRATISQRLLPRKDGNGRIVACEVMINTKAIEECIKDPMKTSFIKDFIEKGRSQYGMQSFDQHLTDLYRQGLITFEIAMGAATNPADFQRALALDSGGKIPGTPEDPKEEELELATSRPSM